MTENVPARRRPDQCASRGGVMGWYASRKKTELNTNGRTTEQRQGPLRTHKLPLDTSVWEIAAENKDKQNERTNRIEACM